LFCEGLMSLPKPALIVVNLFAAVTALGTTPNSARAAVQFFNDRATWQAAAGGATFTEDFSSFAADTPFHSVPVSLSGMTISREGPEAGVSNFIDVPPLVFSGGSGTAQGELFTNFNEGINVGTQVRIAFAQPNVAFGFDAWAASDFEDAILEVYDATAVVGSQALPGGAGPFLGYVLSGGDAATSVRFVSATLIVGTTGEGFAIDNLAGVAVPEPPTVALSSLAGVGAVVLSRRRR